VDIELGAAAFWVSVAAVLIAGGYWKMRGDARKQETLLRLVERTGQLDEAQVKLLFPPSPPMTWGTQHASNSFGTAPGEGRLTWVVISAIVGSIGVGLAVFGAIRRYFVGASNPADFGAVFAAAGLIICVAIGFFIASRFCSPAPSKQDGGQAR
jgi:hypothetical protein